MNRLLVIGDALLDVDIDGTATRLVPDEPAPVVDITGRWVRPGGAGLAAALLATRSCGSEPTDVTLVAGTADDADGEQLAALLAADVTVLGMPLTGGTVSKTRVRVHGRTVARLDHGDGRAARHPLPGRVRDAIRSADAVLVADYGRGIAAHPGLRTELAEVTGRIPVVWDPHPRGPEPVPGCRLVTPNLAEARAFAPAAGRPEDAATELRSRWRADAVVVTMAADGAVLATDGPGPVVIRVPGGAAVAEGADGCGAGDRFAGAVTEALAGGAGARDAVSRAVDAASRFVAGGGAGALGMAAASGRTAVGRGAVAAVAADDERSAFALVDRIRRDGGRVVATGGCFDLVHPGHLDLLRRARTMGDALVVCVNSDDSVRRLKGPARPVIGVRDRVRLLTELRPVDAVIVFDDTDPAALLDRLRPEVWVKGGDYADSALPEAAVVRRHGGRVVVVPTVDGYSTTRLLQEVTSPRWL